MAQEMDSDYELIADLLLLKSGYGNEVTVDLGPNDDLYEIDDCPSKWTLRCQLSPKTAGIKAAQFVELNLIIEGTNKFPREIPCLAIEATSGLTDEIVMDLRKSLQRFAEEKAGSYTLQGLIEYATDVLTSVNLPYGHCSICLLSFDEKDVICKIACNHTYHSRCLAEYVSETRKPSTEEQSDVKRNLGKLICCPVCRVPSNLMEVVGDPTLYPKPVLLENSTDNFDEVFKESQQERAELSVLFEKQQRQGGIINSTESDTPVLNISKVT